MSEEERRTRRRSISPVPMPTSQPKGGNTADWMRLIGLLVVSGLIGGGGGGFAGAYGTARLLEYRIDQLEQDQRDHVSTPHAVTQREIDRVAASVVQVDERRQADMRLVSDRLARIDQRLERIEEALETRRR